jgi:FAD/FMN-containing dehydrogenase
MAMTAPSNPAREAYEARRDGLVERFNELLRQGRTPRLDKRSSNLFRTRPPPDRAALLDVRDFTGVLHVDPERRTAEVTGMTPYVELVDATLPFGLVPAVVPELKSITVGGAVTGGGIESSSFRYGFVHETVEALEVLTADGRVVRATPDGQHRDMFFGFPNSYGTLGYALRLWIKLVPVGRWVRLTHTRYREPGAYFEAMADACRRHRADPDGCAFIDGVCFGPDELVRTEGRFTDQAAPVSRYDFMQIYYRSLRERAQDVLTVRDYLWRWDTDWFWCSRAFGMERPVLRWLFGVLGLLHSTTYWKLRSWNERYRLTERFGKGPRVEWVIQDVEIPVEHAATFLEFLLREIGVRPVWICPAQAFHPAAVFPLYRTDPEKVYINFGFWGGVRSERPAGHYNRMVEDQVRALEGKKSLYSDAYFTPEAFWSIYNQPAYRALKERYDPRHALPDLYAKCVGDRGRAGNDAASP